MIEKGAPVLEGLRFDRVIWRGARRGGAGWRPLVTVGEWLLVGVDPEREGRWLLNVELGAGSLVRSVDWPILVDNVARARRERLPGSSRTNLRVGESLRLVLPPDDREGWRLRGPDGESRVLRPAPALELTDLETPGIREVVRDDATLHRFAVNALDATESDLGGATTGRREAGVEAGEEAAGHLVDPRLHFPLLLAALAAFFGNWWVLERRGRRSAA
ncbi:MAG: hypothetical protein R3F20_13175 [Planctomycetota bacterium]